MYIRNYFHANDEPKATFRCDIYFGKKKYPEVSTENWQYHINMETCRFSGHC